MECGAGVVVVAVLDLSLPVAYMYMHCIPLLQVAIAMVEHRGRCLFTLYIYIYSSSWNAHIKFELLRSAVIAILFHTHTQCFVMKYIRIRNGERKVLSALGHIFLSAIFLHSCLSYYVCYQES